MFLKVRYSRESGKSPKVGKVRKTGDGIKTVIPTLGGIPSIGDGSRESVNGSITTKFPKPQRGDTMVELNRTPFSQAPEGRHYGSFNKTCIQTQAPEGRHSITLIVKFKQVLFIELHFKIM